MDERVMDVPAGLIDPGPNDRKKFDEVKLRELAQSIAGNGLAQRPLLRPKDDGRYEIVAGERRCRAMINVLEWETVPAVVRVLSDEQAAEIMLLENVQREDLNPMEEANAYHSRMQRFGWSIAKTAEKAQVSESTVRNRVALLELVPEAQKLIADGHLGVGFGEEMAGLDVNRQRAALQWLRRQKGMPSRKTFAQYVGKLLLEQNQEKLFDLTLFEAPIVEDAVVEADGRLKEILPRLPELPDMPSLNVAIGQLPDQYAAALLDAGFEREARVIIDFWCKVMDGNYMRLSAYKSELLERHGERLLGQQHQVQEASVVYC